MALLILFHQHHVAQTVDHQWPQLPLEQEDLPVTDGVYARAISSPDQFPELHWLPLRTVLLASDPEQFGLLSRAMQIISWRQHHPFCARCGHATAPHPRGELARVCPACQMHQYPRINPCVIVAIRKGSTQLLARNIRNGQPMAFYSLVAGFVEVGETLEQAVAREVLEEVGIHVHNIRYALSQPWPFPSNLMLGFIADYHHGEIRLQAEEIAEADFFDRQSLPAQLPPAGTISAILIEQLWAEMDRDAQALHP